MSSELPLSAMVDSSVFVEALSGRRTDDADFSAGFISAMVKERRRVLIAAPTLAEIRAGATKHPLVPGVYVVAFDSQAALLLAERMPHELVKQFRDGDSGPLKYYKFDAMIIACGRARGPPLPPPQPVRAAASPTSPTLLVPPRFPNGGPVSERSRSCAPRAQAAPRDGSQARRRNDAGCVVASEVIARGGQVVRVHHVPRQIALPRRCPGPLDRDTGERARRAGRWPAATRPGGRRSDRTMQIKIKAQYQLTAKAHAALVLAGQQIPRMQELELEVDAAEAVDAGVALVMDDGTITQAGADRATHAAASKAHPYTILSGEVYEHELAAHISDPRNLAWPTVADQDHLLTGKEARAMYQATLTARKQAAVTVRRLQAEKDAKAAAEKAEKAAALAARAAQVEALMPRVRAGEGRIVRDPGRYPWQVWLDGKAYNLEFLDAARRELDDIADAREAAAKEAARAARAEWVREHGSSRLKKGLEAGMLDEMAAVYRDERITQELGPDWIARKRAPEPESGSRRNPSEAELDALVAARAKWPDCNVELVTVGGTAEGGGEEYKWRPALTMELPWAHHIEAIRYLD